MAGRCGESGRSVTGKITAILLVVAQGTDRGLTEIARLTGLPVSDADSLAADWSAAGCSTTARTAGAGTRRDRGPVHGPVRLGVLTEPHVTYIEKTPGDPAGDLVRPGCPVPRASDRAGSGTARVRPGRHGGVHDPVRAPGPTGARRSMTAVAALQCGGFGAGDGLREGVAGTRRWWRVPAFRRRGQLPPSGARRGPKTAEVITSRSGSAAVRLVGRRARRRIPAGIPAPSGSPPVPFVIACIPSVRVQTRAAGAEWGPGRYQVRLI